MHTRSHNRVTADGTNDPTAFAKLDVQIWNSNRFRLAAKSIYRAVSLWQRRNLSSIRPLLRPAISRPPLVAPLNSLKRNNVDVNAFVQGGLEAKFQTLGVLNLYFITVFRKGNLANPRVRSSFDRIRAPINYRRWHCVTYPTRFMTIISIPVS